jgi:drug/metabolite transporter (DMT)-like permease
LWRHRTAVRDLSAGQWRRLAVLGLVFYTLTQGGQFLALYYLEAVTVSLLLNFTSLLVALFGIAALQEVPSPLQWGGIIVFLAGVAVYFIPGVASGGKALGYAVAGVTVCANAAAAVLSRFVNREKGAPPLVVTGISMGVGAVALLGLGLVVQGLPRISPIGWAIILWLAAVNTALAFTLWNRSLRTLSAVEASMINSTMLVQIAVLAWLFLGERPGARDVLGLILASAGIALAHAGPSRD